MWLFALWILAFWTYGEGRTGRRPLSSWEFSFFSPQGRFHASFPFPHRQRVPEILRANIGAWNDELYQKLLQMNKGPRRFRCPDGGWVGGKTNGKYAEAEQRFSQGFIFPTSSAFNNLGNVFLLTNRLDQAMDAYLQAARLDPSRAEAYYNLGQAYLLKLRMKEAEAEFLRAKALDRRRFPIIPA